MSEHVQARIFSNPVLLDEPTAALDDRTMEQVMQQVQQWVREKNLIAVMVCHDLSLVERYADRRLEL